MAGTHDNRTMVETLAEISCLLVRRILFYKHLIDKLANGLYR